MSNLPEPRFIDLKKEEKLRRKSRPVGVSKAYDAIPLDQLMACTVLAIYKDLQKYIGLVEQYPENGREMMWIHMRNSRETLMRIIVVIKYRSADDTYCQEIRKLSQKYFVRMQANQQLCQTHNHFVYNRSRNFDLLGALEVKVNGSYQQRMPLALDDQLRELANEGASGEAEETHLFYTPPIQGKFDQLLRSLKTRVMPRSDNQIRMEKERIDRFLTRYNCEISVKLVETNTKLNRFFQTYFKKPVPNPVIITYNADLAEVSLEWQKFFFVRYVWNLQGFHVVLARFRKELVHCSEGVNTEFASCLEEVLNKKFAMDPQMDAIGDVVFIAMSFVTQIGLVELTRQAFELVKLDKDFHILLADKASLRLRIFPNADSQSLLETGDLCDPNEPEDPSWAWIPERGVEFEFCVQNSLLEVRFANGQTDLGLDPLYFIENPIPSLSPIIRKISNHFAHRLLTSFSKGLHPWKTRLENSYQLSILLDNLATFHVMVAPSSGHYEVLGLSDGPPDQLKAWFDFASGYLMEEGTSLQGWHTCLTLLSQSEADLPTMRPRDPLPVRWNFGSEWSQVHETQEFAELDQIEHMLSRIAQN